jgi:cell division protein FtsQ
MRRPSPLPPPAGASPSRGRDEPSVPPRSSSAPDHGDTDAAASASEPATGSGSSAASDREWATGDPDTQETAPIAPLVFPGSRPAGAPDPAGSPPAPIDDGPVRDGEDADTGPVGVRDVWRAARARRRALRAEVRRFTVRQRRRRIVWIGVAASLVLVTVATVGAAYSPLFAVERVQIIGTQQLAAEDVAGALSGQVGTPLAAIDESAVKAALVQFPLVESYTLEARPPHDLVVRIVERTPIGVVSSAAGYTLVDAAGVALSTTPDAPAGYPLLDVSGGVSGAAFEAAGRTMRSLPADLRAQVTAVAASTPDDVTLTLGATNATIVWGSAEDSAMKARVLQSLMGARPPDGVAAYDVSSPSAPVVR